MRFVFFCHAFTSCWNNGNAHFLRGVARELHDLQHEVAVWEPADGWSRTNALADGGGAALAEVATLFEGIERHAYPGQPDLDEALQNADVVVVHEWTPLELVSRIAAVRRRGAAFTLLFHDTHHRAVTSPDEMRKFDLDGFDGVLAFGDVLREIYLRLGWEGRTFTWHEAADTRLYRPRPEIEHTHDLVWIGNWGDGERSAELQEYLIDPVAKLSLDARIHGVRYSADALSAIAAAGIEYCGWLPAHRAPEALARARVTVHVPRAPYARLLRGIPTIRVFEALACGIPLVTAPWEDSEGLFPDGAFLRAADGTAMAAALRDILSDPALAQSLCRTGRAAVEERHTCRHRALELLQIVSDLRRTAASPIISNNVEALP